ncbi:high mobility group box domain-containing protein [Lipomyces doorenjongii]
MSSKKPSRGGLAAPPSIPQSEEVKYRQKCKDLKNRIHEIEEQNDVLTLRLARSKRAVQRMRLERALLLEKLEERTFLKVDDSEGSPSPPPSPPRIHSRHRRRESDGSLSPVGESTTGGFTAFTNNGATSKANHSQSANSSSNAAITGHHHAKKKQHTQRDPNAPKRPQNAYIIFCDHEKERVRAQLEQSQPGETFDLTKAMAEAWRDLGDEGRKPFYELYDAEKARYNREMEAYVPPGSVLPIASVSATVATNNAIPPVSSPTPTADDTVVAIPTSQLHEDVVVEEEDEDMEDISFGGGFTAVNRR